MRIGIGLPNAVADAPGELIPAWARRAEDAGFSALATIDRIVYPSYESLVSLAAAAAVTERVELVTDVVVAPTRNAVLLAKEAASVDRISGGRLVLGVAPGARADDFDATGQDYTTRGRRFDADLQTMHDVWDGKALSDSGKASVPGAGRRVPLLLGGTSDKAIERTIEWGAGWTAGGGGPEAARHTAAKVRSAWSDAGRDGSPRIAALTYFALGPRAREGAEASLRDYYAFIAQWADAIVEGSPTTVDALRDAVAAYADAGVDDLMLIPTIAELDQVDLAADAVL
ncbi:MAG TPA: LLM class flavin-dependent oxidoreductase [Actinomycetota bacterium]|nr:LLM class flavin-dependent oxidoreductase [Actinomycetota bacterium]